MNKIIPVEDAVALIQDADVVAVVVEPADQAVTFLGGENKDIVFADGVTGLDGDALRASPFFQSAIGRRHTSSIL